MNISANINPLCLTTIGTVKARVLMTAVDIDISIVSIVLYSKLFKRDTGGDAIRTTERKAINASKAMADDAHGNIHCVELPRVLGLYLAGSYHGTFLDRYSHPEAQLCSARSSSISSHGGFYVTIKR